MKIEKKGQATLQRDQASTKKPGGNNRPPMSTKKPGGNNRPPQQKMTRRISRPPSAEKSTPQPQKSQNAPKTISNVLGEIVWLMARSVNHRYLFISDLEWIVMQPVALAQYRLFYSKDHPVGVALWASVNEEVEGRLKKGITKMSPQDWNSGDRFWLIDLIAPFGNVAAMLNDLQKHVFRDRVFQYIQRDDKGNLITRSSKETYSKSVDRPTGKPHAADGRAKE